MGIEADVMAGVVAPAWDYREVAQRWRWAILDDTAVAVPPVDEPQHNLAHALGGVLIDGESYIATYEGQAAAQDLRTAAERGEVTLHQADEMQSTVGHREWCRMVEATRRARAAEAFE